MSRGFVGTTKGSAGKRDHFRRAEKFVNEWLQIEEVGEEVVSLPSLEQVTTQGTSDRMSSTSSSPPPYFPSCSFTTGWGRVVAGGRVLVPHPWSSGVRAVVVRGGDSGSDRPRVRVFLVAGVERDPAVSHFLLRHPKSLT